MICLTYLNKGNVYQMYGFLCYKYIIYQIPIYYIISNKIWVIKNKFLIKFESKKYSIRRKKKKKKVGW